MTAKFKTIGFSAAYIVVLLGMLFGLFFATKPIVEKKAMQGKIAMYSEVLTGIDTIEDVKKDTDPVTILDKHQAKNDKGEVIATLYRAFKTNQYASSTDTGIELLVSIDKDGKILGIKVTVDQSISPELTKKYVESFKGSNIQTPKSMDGVSRPSVVFSLATVDEILKDIATSQGVEEVEKTVYEVIFGDDYVLGAKEDINEGVIKHVYPVTGSIKNGKVFYLEGSDHYNGPDSDVKPAGVRILVSNNNEFLGYDFDDEEVVYEHTKGFQKFVKEFLDGFVGQKLPEIADDIDTASGASFSKALVYDMILELGTYLGNIETTIYQDIYGLDVMVSEKEDINDGVVKYAYTATSSELSGKAYYIEKTGVYRDASEGKLGVLMFLDEDGIVLGYSFDEEEVVYEHTESFKKNVETFLDALIGTDLNNLATDLDTTTGSTNSTNLVYDMLQELGAYVKTHKPTIYNKLYGAGAVVSEKIEINDESVIHSYLVSSQNKNGVAYYIEKTGVYRGTSEGKLGVMIFTDAKGIFLGYSFEEADVVYEHTPSFQKNVATFLDALVGTDLNNLATDLDTTTGSTNSTNLVYDMLQELGTYIKDHKPTGFQGAYGMDAETSAKKDINDGSIKHSYDVTAVIHNGTAYYLEKTAVFRGTSEAIIGVMIFLDENNIMIGYSFEEADVVYEHTPSFQKNIVTFLDALVGTNLNNLATDLDTTTGSTNSTIAVYDMLVELSAYVKEA